MVPNDESEVPVGAQAPRDMFENICGGKKPRKLTAGIGKYQQFLGSKCEFFQVFHQTYLRYLS